MRVGQSIDVRISHGEHRVLRPGFHRVVMNYRGSCTAIISLMKAQLHKVPHALLLVVVVHPHTIIILMPPVMDGLCMPGPVWVV